MARPRSKQPRIDPVPFQAEVSDLIHDGRGVARRSDGKTVFITGALPDETVLARQIARNRSYDEAVMVEVLVASPHRVVPRCPHFGTCGGCALQHLDADQQILAKQRVLVENLQRIAKATPAAWLPPLVDAAWNYRRKGRFSVRAVPKKDRTLVGFRELDPRFVADLTVCHTAIEPIGMRIPALSAMINALDASASIPQVEFIAGDDTVALVFRHLLPLSDADLAALVAFGQAQGFAIFLQPGGVESVQALWPAEPDLSFKLAAWDVTLAFRPLDFIQVNAGLNDAMIARALELLDAGPEDRVLDLFCGLGNFTLPLARMAGSVVGVEGDAGLVQRARDNALRNGIDNVAFHAADLTQDLRDMPWMRRSVTPGPGHGKRFDMLLLDPPRSGAEAVLRQFPLDGLQRIVYVSCHPGSLARDAGFLVHERGWKLRAAGVMDMFPQTAHVESIAVFEP